MGNAPQMAPENTPPEHLFEPDGFPTNILLVMFAVGGVVLIGSVVVVMAYFEMSLHAEQARKDALAVPELVELREHEAKHLRSEGFVACPEVAAPADPNAPTPRDLQCAPEEASYRINYDIALDSFLKGGDVGALATAPVPAGAAPSLPPGHPPVPRQPGAQPGKRQPPQRGKARPGGQPLQLKGQPKRPGAGSIQPIQLRPGTARPVPNQPKRPAQPATP